MHPCLSSSMWAPITNLEQGWYSWDIRGSLFMRWRMLMLAFWFAILAVLLQNFMWVSIASKELKHLRSLDKQWRSAPGHAFPILYERWNWALRFHDYIDWRQFILLPLKELLWSEEANVGFDDCLLGRWTRNSFNLWENTQQAVQYIKLLQICSTSNNSATWLRLITINILASKQLIIISLILQQLLRLVSAS